jgi:hypothetical protein
LNSAFISPTSRSTIATRFLLAAESLEQSRALRVLFLVALGDGHRLGVLDPVGELFAAPNGFQLRTLAREPGACLLDALAEVIEAHSRLHERLAHLRDDRAARIATGRGAV